MGNKEPAFFIRSKLWIEDKDGDVVFGLGRYRILSVIREQGSMHAAAKALKMSYRAVWMRIRKSEERIGKPLVVRDGKGSKLTPFAERLVKRFKRVHSIVAAESDDVYKDLMLDQFPKL